MALIECAECKGQVSDTADKCPHCGARVPRRGRWWKLMIGAVVVLFAAFLAIGLMGGWDSPKVIKAKQECAKMLSNSAPGEERRLTQQICDLAIQSARENP